MDVTPFVPADRQVIQSYGVGRFQVSDTVYEGAIIVLPDQTMRWAVASVDAVTLESLQPVLDAVPPVEVLLLGTGERTQMLPAELRRSLRASGIGVEPMATGPACRTYNVLLAEERRVAAAMLAL